MSSLIQVSTMGRRSRCFATVLLTLFLGLSWSVTRAQAAPDCTFELGFKALRDQIPNIVGTCLENENHNPVNGDGLQHTTGGLLVWRKLDNWTAFTDGSHTWINGPNGLQERLNTDRFPWEVINMAGKAASDLPGTPIDVGTVLTSVVDWNTKRYDVYAVNLTAGQTLHFDLQGVALPYIRVFTPGTKTLFDSAGNLTGGADICYSGQEPFCSSPFNAAVTGVYYIVVASVQDNSPGVKYRLRVTAS